MERKGVVVMRAPHYYGRHLTRPTTMGVFGLRTNTVGSHIRVQAPFGPAMVIHVQFFWTPG